MRDPEEENEKNLSCILKYLSGTRDIVLALEYDSTGTVKCWVDAASAVHHDMKSHTGRMMSMGLGALYSASREKKLNTKSSTKVELVGVDDLMPKLLCMQ